MVTDLANAPVKIIDFGGKKEEWILRQLDDLGMENAAVINLHRLNHFKNFSDLFNQFKELIENAEIFKILYSKIKDDVENIPASINCWVREDVLYVGDTLKFNKDVICRYWNWKNNLKSSVSQPPYF